MAELRSSDPTKDWPRARLLGSIHAIKIAAVVDQEDGSVSVQGEHSEDWYNLDATWRKTNEPAVGSYLLHFSKGGQVALTDPVFVQGNLKIES